MGLVYLGLLFKTESVRLIEVCVLAECCSSLLTAHKEMMLFVFLWHFAVKTPTKGTRILGRAALHLGVNFCRTLSFPINYRTFDSQFCHLLWAPLCSLGVLFSFKASCISADFECTEKLINSELRWDWVKRKFSIFLFVCLVPGVLQSVCINKAARGLICTNSLIISSDIILGFHIAACISKTEKGRIEKQHGSGEGRKMGGSTSDTALCIFSCQAT